MNPVFPLIVSLLVTLVCAYGLVRLGGVKTDVPNERSSHAAPTPRGGGLAFVGGTFAGWIFLTPPEPMLSSLAIGAAFICALGVVDDVKGLPSAARFGLEILIAAGIAAAGGRWSSIALGPFDIVLPPVIGGGLAVLWIVWVTNLYNFMDGINGIATLQGIAVSAAFVALGIWTGAGGISLIAACLLVSLLAFLPFNFPRARIFMGDSGSLPLGFIFAVLPLHAHSHLGARFSLVHGALLLGPFFLDATITLIRRALRGEKVYEAHRSHFYQWLQDLLVSHSRTALLYALAATMFVAVVLHDVAIGASGGSPWLYVAVGVTCSAFAFVAIAHRRYPRRARSQGSP